MLAYNDLISRPMESKFASLYMQFCDAFIAKNKLKFAKVLMSKIETIAHFNTPRIWMRFADCYALQNEVDKAMDGYLKVKNCADSSVQILQSAQFKLLQLYFSQNDETNAQKLLASIKKSIRCQNENANTNESESGDEMKRIQLNPQLRCYFDTGLFGSVLLPKELLTFELLRTDLRSQYKKCKQLLAQNLLS